MLKYDEGDRIQLISIDERDKEQGLRIGNTGVCLTDGTTPIVKWDNKIRNWCVVATQIKLIKKNSSQH